MTSQDQLHAALVSTETYVRAGQKIQAIKALRGATGLGLKEAKDAVEYFQVHGVWRSADVGAALSSGATASQHIGMPVVTGTQQAAGNEQGIHAELSKLLHAGRKIEAIKRYREIYGVGLKEAKDAVERLSAGVGLAVGGAAPAATAAPTLVLRTPVALATRAPAVPTPALVTPSPRDFGAGTSQPPWAKASSHEPSQPHGSSPASPLLAAQAALAQRLGTASAPLAAVPAESGLYRGFLFVTPTRVVFVADRYGMFSVTEDIERADLERVEVKDGPFGADLVLQAGFHSAHFSEMQKAQAEALRDFLLGNTKILDVPADVHPTAAVSLSPIAAPPLGSPPPALFAETNTPASHQHPEQRNFQPSPVAPQHAAVAQLPARRFSLVRLIFAAAFAAVPSLLVSMAPRWLPMNELPVFVFPILFWSALALGGGLRGHGGPMIQAGFIVGLVHAAVAYAQGGMHNEMRAISLAILGAVYWHARKANHWLTGAIFVVPVLFLDGVLGLQVMLSDVVVSTTAFSFWFVQFGIEDFQAHRRVAASAAKPS